jgi:hypothetical protein
VATGSSSEAADRARSSPELTSRAREEAGIGAFERDAHRERDGGVGEAGEGLTATYLVSSFSAAGGDLAKQASYPVAIGFN